MAALTALLAVQFAADPADAARRKRTSSSRPAVVKEPPLPPSAAFPADAPAKTELSAGPLKATLVVTSGAASRTVGDIARVDVLIPPSAGNGSATLLAETDGGEVISISGNKTRTGKTSAGQSVDLKLDQSGSNTVTIDLELKGGSRGADGKARSRLRVTLKSPTGAEDQGIISFGLIDCAGDYYAGLQKLLNDRRELMTTTIDAGQVTEPGFTGKWLFQPTSASPLLICKGKKAAKIPACAGVDEKKGDTAEQPAMDERRILGVASVIMAVKGALPNFQKRSQAVRQSTFTVLSQVRAYMEQKQHPALCTAVPGMLDYFISRTEHVQRPIAEVKAALPAGQALAVAKVTAFASGTAATPAAAGGSGLITVANAAPAAVSAYSPNDLIDRLAKVALSSTDASDVSTTLNPIDKLHRVKTFLDDKATPGLTDDRRADFVGALRLIEANLYLAAGAEKYGKLDNAVYGTLNAVRDTYKANCTCGG